MKNQIKWFGSVALLGSFSMLFAQCEQTEITSLANSDAITESELRSPADAPNVCECLIANLEYEELSDAEKEAILFMREEEKLARDVYSNLADKWNAKIFSNITKSEQRHMDAVGCLINKYGLVDPIRDDEIGIFQNGILQDLYDELMTKGLESLEAGLLVGATIEDVDIRDLVQNMENPEVNNEDIQVVFNNLLKGSRNHMRAFTFNLENRDITYEVQYIGQEDYEAIMNSEMERGNGDCANCQGNGRGKGNKNGKNQANCSDMSSCCGSSKKADPSPNNRRRGRGF